MISRVIALAIFAGLWSAPSPSVKAATVKSCTEDSVGVHIRWMIRRDMKEILATENLSFEYPWMEEDFIRALRQRNCIGMVAEIGDKVVGYMVYELHKNQLHLLNFVVHPDYQRVGVGEKMIAKLVGKLNRQRRNQISLELRETNVRAQLFFRDMGFKVVSRLEDYYEDTTEDSYIFQYQVQAGVEEAKPLLSAADVSRLVTTGQSGAPVYNESDLSDLRVSLQRGDLPLTPRERRRVRRAAKRLDAAMSRIDDALAELESEGQSPTTAADLRQIDSRLDELSGYIDGGMSEITATLPVYDQRLRELSAAAERAKDLRDRNGEKRFRQLVVQLQAARNERALLLWYLERMRGRLERNVRENINVNIEEEPVHQGTIGRHIEAEIDWYNRRAG